MCCLARGIEFQGILGGISDKRGKRPVGEVVGS